MSSGTRDEAADTDTGKETRSLPGKRLSGPKTLVALPWAISFHGEDVPVLSANLAWAATCTFASPAPPTGQGPAEPRTCLHALPIGCPEGRASEAYVAQRLREQRRWLSVAVPSMLSCVFPSHHTSSLHPCLFPGFQVSSAHLILHLPDVQNVHSKQRVEGGPEPRHSTEAPAGPPFYLQGALGLRQAVALQIPTVRQQCEDSCLWQGLGCRQSSDSGVCWY